MSHVHVEVVTDERTHRNHRAAASCGNGDQVQDLLESEKGQRQLRVEGSVLVSNWQGE